MQLFDRKSFSPPPPPNVGALATSNADEMAGNLHQRHHQQQQDFSARQSLSQSPGAIIELITKHQAQALLPRLSSLKRSHSCISVSPPAVAGAGIIGLETRDALYPATTRGWPQQGRPPHHSSGVVVDMGKVVGVLRGHVPDRDGGGGGLGDNEGEGEEEGGGGEEHLGCNL